jgi:hypothetical protein
MEGCGSDVEKVGVLKPASRTASPFLMLKSRVSVFCTHENKGKRKHHYDIHAASAAYAIQAKHLRLRMGAVARRTLKAGYDLHHDDRIVNVTT